MPINITCCISITWSFSSSTHLRRTSLILMTSSGTQERRAMFHPENCQRCFIQMSIFILKLKSVSTKNFLANFCCNIRTCFKQIHLLAVLIPALPNLPSTNSAKFFPEISSDCPALQESLTVRIPTWICSMAVGTNTKSIRHLSIAFIIKLTHFIVKL